MQRVQCHNCIFCKHHCNLRNVSRTRNAVSTPILSRRHAQATAEETVEILRRGKSGQPADFDRRIRCLSQKTAGFAYAQAVDFLMNGTSQRFHKNVFNLRMRTTRLSNHLCGIDAGREFPPNQAQSLGKPRGLNRVNFRRSAFNNPSGQNWGNPATGKGQQSAHADASASGPFSRLICAR